MIPSWSGHHDGGGVFAIRSERQLCREVQVNLAYRWFCGLGLEDASARHARFRDNNLLRQTFEQVVERCTADGLVGGERVCGGCKPD